MPRRTASMLPLPLLLSCPPVLAAAPSSSAGAPLLLALLLLIGSTALYSSRLINRQHYRREQRRLLQYFLLAGGLVCLWHLLAHDIGDTLYLCGLTAILAAHLWFASQLSERTRLATLKRVLLDDLFKQSRELQRRNDELLRSHADLQQSHDELQALSFRDPLTGAFNRLYFERQLQNEWQRAQRHQSPLALLLLDVNKVRDINRHHGHSTGDQALCQAATLLLDDFRRGTDMVCRIGADEFAVLLPDTNQAQAETKAGSLARQLTNRCLPLGNQQLPLQVHLGVACCVPGAAMHPLSLLQAAEDALAPLPNSQCDTGRQPQDTGHITT